MSALKRIVKHPSKSMRFDCAMCHNRATHKVRYAKWALFWTCDVCAIQLARELMAYFSPTGLPPYVAGEPDPARLAGDPQP